MKIEWVVGCFIGSLRGGGGGVVYYFFFYCGLVFIVSRHITSGNWRAKHNSLSREAGADPAKASRGRPVPLELPHYGESVSQNKMARSMEPLGCG